MIRTWCWLLCLVLLPGSLAFAQWIQLTEYPVPHPTTLASTPWGIVPGPDGAMWFTDFNQGEIGRITTTGVVTQYPIPTAGSQPQGITVGPDNALWFVEAGPGFGPNKIGRITTAGVITEFPIGSSAQPWSIAAGSDGALWFTAASSSGSPAQIWAHHYGGSADTIPASIRNEISALYC